MAEVTVTTTAPDTYFDRDAQGLKVRRRIVSVAADGDTYTSGIRGIQDVWWSGDTATDLATCTFVSSTGVITFEVGGAATGTILIRSRS